MKEWIKISLILCSFGFLREMRPSEPFVTEFLSSNIWRNVTSEQVNRELYPLGTYSYLAQLCVVFLITDILRYKPIIIASSFVALILWSLLLWTSSLEALYIVQVCYGFFMASEVAYYTYMYAKVSKDKYQKVTGHARASLLAGRFIASILAQILVTFEFMDLRQLNFISLGAQGFSLIIALLLPAVGVSVYMWKHESTGANYGSHQNPNEFAISNEKDSDDIRPSFSWNRARKLMWEHFVEAYTNRTVVCWSIWWSLAMAGFLQVQSYVQLLWQEIDPKQENLYNGAAEALLTLFGAISALLAGVISSKGFEKYDLWILSSCSLIEGSLIIYSSVTNNVWIAYLMYIVFGVLYMFMITLASATVAKNLAEDSFALIFGINSCFALIIQTILTISVVSEAGLGLSPRGQFSVFGGYFVALAFVYFVSSLIRSIYLKISQQH